MLRWSGLLARLVVGVVWIVAGAIKLPDINASRFAVRAYQLLPVDVADAVGAVLPMLEVVVGACLVLGLLTRFVGVLSALLQVAFIIGIVSVWSRGIAIDCGCFGNGGPNPDAFSQYPWEIARDVGLLALSLFLVRWPRSALGVDSLLFGQERRPAEAPAHSHEEVDVEAES